MQTIIYTYYYYCYQLCPWVRDCTSVGEGHQEDVTCELSLGNWRLLSPSLLLRMYILPTVPIVGAIARM